MRFFFALALTFVLFRLSGQIPDGNQFSLVKSFDSGLLTSQDGGGDPTWPYTMATDGIRWYVYDPLKTRVVILDRKFETIGEVKTDVGWQYRLTSVAPGLLLWTDFNVGRGKFGLLWFTVAPGPARRIAEPAISPYQRENRDYSFLFRYQDVLIFQNHAGSFGNPQASFFGIRGLAATTDLNQEYLNDAAVRELLADQKNRRYTVRGNLVLDHETQVLSADDVSIANYFRQWSKDPISSPTDANAALANGGYFFSGMLQAYVEDDRGLNAVATPRLVRDSSLYYSYMFPAPDGYIYQLRGDYTVGVTRLYRVGPYPELKLEYRGKGGTINDNNVNLREEPNTKSAVVARLNKDTPVRIMDRTASEESVGGQRGIWYLVRLWDRTEGWVFGAFLTPK